MMMKAGDLDEHLRQTLLLQIKGAQFGVVHAENLLFHLHQVAPLLRRRMINGPEVLGKNGGHDDFAHIMHQARNVIALPFRRFHQVHQLPRQQRRADAMPPELPPGKAPVLRQFLKVLNDRCHHRQLADLPDSQKKNRLLDVLDRIGQAVINRIDQVQQPRGQAGSRRMISAICVV